MHVFRIREPIELRTTSIFLFLYLIHCILTSKSLSTLFYVNYTTNHSKKLPLPNKSPSLLVSIKPLFVTLARLLSPHQTEFANTVLCSVMWNLCQIFVSMASYKSIGNYLVYKWRAQSKNDPLIFRPFLKVFRSS